MLQNLQNLFFAADPIFPGIAFFKSEVRNRITSSGATVESTGLSVSIPAGTLREEDSTDLLIRPCFSGPFELPAEYVSASPAYLIQLSGRVTIQKDVTIRMHHYANLKTEEDCEDMVFLSASSIPQKDMSTMVYRFKRITGARILFRPGIPVGDITLRHFCLLKVARWIGRMSRHYLVGPGKLQHFNINNLPSCMSLQGVMLVTVLGCIVTYFPMPSLMAYLQCSVCA